MIIVHQTWTFNELQLIIYTFAFAPGGVLATQQGVGVCVCKKWNKYFFSASGKF